LEEHIMSRIVKVAKLGESGKNVEFDGEITYRELVKMAGYASTDGVFVNGYGAVSLDEPVHSTVTSVVVSMPKFAGGILPANLRVVDENGTEWRPVAGATDDDEVMDDEDSEAMGRTIKVASLGNEYVPVTVTGALTYRTLIMMAGFASSDGVFVNGLGAVNLDEPVGDDVTSVVVSMPKFAGGSSL
jgi:uncharacterized membrane protein